MFFYHCLELNSIETAQFAIELYGLGQAILGTLLVRPSNDLRRERYYFILSGNTNIELIALRTDGMMIYIVVFTTTAIGWFIDYGSAQEDIEGVFVVSVRGMSKVASMKRRDFGFYQWHG